MYVRQSEVGDYSDSGDHSDELVSNYGLTATVRRDTYSNTETVKWKMFLLLSIMKWTSLYWQLEKSLHTVAPF